MHIDKNHCGDQVLYTITLDTKQLGYFEIYQWLQREKIEYQLGIPWGRDFIYKFSFKQRNDAVLFSLRYADHMLEK